MGDNLPPGVTVSDLPGNEPKNQSREVECAVCGAPTRVRTSRGGPHFCDSHDENDLQDMTRERPDAQHVFERGPRRDRNL